MFAQWWVDPHQWCEQVLERLSKNVHWAHCHKSQKKWYGYQTAKMPHYQLLLDKCMNSTGRKTYTILVLMNWSNHISTHPRLMTHIQVEGITTTSCLLLFKKAKIFKGGTTSHKLEVGLVKWWTQRQDSKEIHDIHKKMLFRFFSIIITPQITTSTKCTLSLVFNPKDWWKLGQQQWMNIFYVGLHKKTGENGSQRRWW